MIIQLLHYICWGDFNDFSTVNNAFIYFYDILFAVIKDTVPVVKIKSNDFPHWYNLDLIKMVKEKEKLRKKYVKNGRDKCTGSEHYIKYSCLRQ